jgi:hypothetical protein
MTQSATLAATLEPASALAVLSAGVFFLTALASGVWKWRGMMTSPDHQAHPYVDIAHRASLHYSFAALLLGCFAALSAWSALVDVVATAFPLAYFAIAIGTYVWHGARRDTDNQFARRTFASTWGAATLAIAEIGGFVVLFAGVITTLLR